MKKITKQILIPVVVGVAITLIAQHLTRGAQTQSAKAERPTYNA